MPGPKATHFATEDQPAGTWILAKRSHYEDGESAEDWILRAGTHFALLSCRVVCDGRKLFAVTVSDEVLSVTEYGEFAQLDRAKQWGECTLAKHML